MAEGISNNSEQIGIEDSVEAEMETKEMVSELTSLGDEFRRLLDPEVTVIIDIKRHSLYYNTSNWLFN